MNDRASSWTEELAALRRRAERLRARGPMPDPLRRIEGQAGYARLRETARALFEATVAAYQGLCPEGYPRIDDNGILGTGGAIGIRFSDHHSFWFSFERVRPRRPQPARAGPVATAAPEPVSRRRLPGEPLPPPDPDEPVRLAMLALRWDERNGWSELHRPLDPRWDERLLREHLAAFLTGVAYDLTVIPGTGRCLAPEP
jgi:hypothetical protein